MIRALLRSVEDRSRQEFRIRGIIYIYKTLFQKERLASGDQAFSGGNWMKMLQNWFSFEIFSHLFSVRHANWLPVRSRKNKIIIEGN
ncbi:MAG: hypothetical protein ACE15F_06800 [bacterium]